MVTVHREAGMRFVIFTDDHEPAHVHVQGDGKAKINLVGADGRPELVNADAMKGGDIRKALRAVTAHQDYLLGRWREFHG